MGLPDFVDVVCLLYSRVGGWRKHHGVYTTSPAGDVTADSYASTEGWATLQGNSGNYTAGNLYEEDVYNGSTTTGVLLSKTVNIPTLVAVAQEQMEYAREADF